MKKMKRWRNTWTLPENKKTVTVIPIVVGTLRIVSKGFKKTGRTGNLKKNQGHLDNSIVKID